MQTSDTYGETMVLKTMVRFAVKSFTASAKELIGDNIH